MDELSKEDVDKLLEVLHIHQDGLDATRPEILKDLRDSDIEEQLDNLITIEEDTEWVERVMNYFSRKRAEP